MNKEQKAAAVDEIAEGLSGAEAIFAVDYRGISVPQAAQLRARLAEADAVFSVVKNRLAKLAAERSGTADLDELLVGPTALTLIKGDPVTAAKAISTFGREHQILAYKGGIMDGAPLDPDGFAAIARLPGLDVLHGQLVGMTASPLTGLVAGMGNLVSGLGRQLAQIAEQGLVSGGETADAGPQTADGGRQTADAGQQDEASGAAQASADNDEDEESSEESAPDGEGSEETDSETTPEEE